MIQTEAFLIDFVILVFQNEKFMIRKSSIEINNLCFGELHVTKKKVIVLDGIKVKSYFDFEMS